MFCTKCGYNLGDANFCPHCGTPSVKTTVTTTVEEEVLEVAQPVVEEALEQEIIEEDTVEETAQSIEIESEAVEEAETEIEPEAVEEAETEIESETAEETESEVEEKQDVEVESEEEVAAEVEEEILETPETLETDVSDTLSDNATEPEFIDEFATEIEAEIEADIEAEIAEETTADAESTTIPVAPVEPISAPSMPQQVVAPPQMETQQVVASQPQMETQQVVAPQPQMASPQQVPQQQNNASLTWSNQSQEMWNTYQPTTKKKSKAPIIIGVVAALAVAIICAVVFFVLPMLDKSDEEAANVNLSGANVLKSMTASIKSSVSNVVSNTTFVKTSSKQKAEGTFTINKAVVDNEDFMSYLNVDTVSYVFEVDSDTNKMGATINLSDGNATPVVNLTCYTDGSTVYVKIPELFSNSLKTTEVEVETDTDFDSMANVLSKMDEETMKQYAKVIESVVGHIVSGIDHVIDKAQYTKNEGTVTISAKDLGSETVESYIVSINKSDIIEGFNKAVDAIFDDQTIVPYITMLAVVGTKLDREELKSDFASGMTDIVDTVKFTLYSKEQQFAGISINMSEMIKDANGTLEILSFSTDSLLNCVYVEAVNNGEYIKMSWDGRTALKKLTIDMDFTDSYYTFNYNWQVDGNTVEIKALDIVGKSGTSNVSFSMTAKSEISDITGVSISESDFSNVIDMDNATETQSGLLTIQLMANISKVLSEKGIREYLYSFIN